MAADDGRGSQRGERQSAGSARGNSNTNNSARGDARESRSQEASRSGGGAGVGTNAPSRGTGGNTGPSRSSGASDRNNGQSGARESRGVTAGSVGAVGRERDTSIGRGLAGAAGLAGPSLGGNVTSTYQGRPSSVASAALSRQSLAPDRAMPTGPVRGNMPSSVTPSFRVSENLSMSKLANMRAPSFRATEEQATAKEDAWQDALSTIRAPEAGTKDPYNRVVQGKNTPSYANLTGMTIGEVRQFQRAMKASGQYPSTAVGAYQIVGSTLDEAQARTGLPDTAKFTKATQDFLARDLWSNRASQVDDATGAVAAGPLANRAAKEWASFQQSSGIGAYDSDGVNHASVPHSTVLARADGLVSTGAVGTQAPTQTRALGRQTGAPARQSMVERVATTYLGRPASVASSVARNNMAREQPAPASSFPARPAGPVSTNLGALDRPNSMPSRELMSDAEQAAVYGEQPGGAPVAPREVRPTSPSPTKVDPAYSVRPVSPTPNSPEIAPTVPSTPVPAVKATPVAPSEEPTVKAPLTTGQKVIAGGIDVGVGLIPGVGLAATVYNGLASLTGQPTIGGMAVDLLGGGSNLGTGGPRRNEESGRRSNYEPPAPKEPETTIKKPPEVERFRERYLIPSINRPTPAEKWGRRKMTA